MNKIHQNGNILSQLYEYRPEMTPDEVIAAYVTGTTTPSYNIKNYKAVKHLSYTGCHDYTTTGGPTQAVSLMVSSQSDSYFKGWKFLSKDLNDNGFPNIYSETKEEYGFYIGTTWKYSKARVFTFLYKDYPSRYKLKGILRKIRACFQEWPTESHLHSMVIYKNLRERFDFWTSILLGEFLAPFYSSTNGFSSNTHGNPINLTNIYYPVHGAVQLDDRQCSSINNCFTGMMVYPVLKAYPTNYRLVSAVTHAATAVLHAVDLYEAGKYEEMYAHLRSLLPEKAPLNAV